MSGTRRRFTAGLVALVVSAAMVGSVRAESAGAAPATITGSRSTTPKAGSGTVTKTSTGYDICVPYWAKGVSHHFELTDAAGNVVDSFDYTVPADEKTENVVTRNGVSIAIATTHSGGVGTPASPSKGCLEYEAKAKAKAKAKSKKSSKKK